ncbi:pyridoxamine 5'-phosphate oxidase family protein [Streptomyces sp. NPDC002018]|uniref:pyridoxamine 5'-phosphate oxidase family protein n=1 Tax=Streptomyces sp. NPDC002018 TaxID=3364629 RepID=UPI0036C1FCFB
MSRYPHLAYTPHVVTVQEEMGSGAAGRRRLLGSAGHAEVPDPLTAAEAAFVQGLDGFLMATVGDTGWPYIQFRGGPPGFVQVLDEHTLGYADVRGNRQYITMGNLRGDDRVALFFIDYARQTRLKMFGRAAVTPAADAPGLLERLSPSRTDGQVEQLVTLTVEAFDWNCPKHITPRFSERELAEALAPTRHRIAQLEGEVASLRAELDALRGP